MENSECRIQNAEPRHRRRGISLMEVLISIGIVAVGLVSIAALIPVGGIQAQKADIEQRKAETGLERLSRIQNPRHGPTARRKRIAR